MKIGVLVIGSLHWDDSPPRPRWRRERLDWHEQEKVRVPIRYGRQSRSRGHSYTMVFSPSLAADRFGTAIAIPFNCSDLTEEAEWLWAAEALSPAGPTGRISASWGCVALCENPDRHISGRMRDGWKHRVEREPGYGRLIRADGEDDVVDTSGFLKIGWPRTDADAPLEWNALRATANSPSVANGSYPSVTSVADGWGTRNGRKYVSYFWNNKTHGISTFQDEEIACRLTKFGLKR